MSVLFDVKCKYISILDLIKSWKVL